ncbi:MAG TPA: biotin transporter BioY [Trueperaceae bacterium]|nr:biotin transporter BioY [Trueperaceae bacterium]
MPIQTVIGSVANNPKPPTTLLSVLIDRLVPVTAPRVAPRLVVLLKVAGGVLLLALLAQVRLQIGPVPITGQTLGVLLLGAAYGLPLGVTTVVAYALLGAAGLPVFAGGGSGLAYLAGPTGGYLVGFVLAAALLGYLARRGWDQSLASCALAMGLASLTIYLPGLAWLHYALGLGWRATVAAGLTPFLVGDVIKLAIAAVALPGAWRFLGAR